MARMPRMARRLRMLALRLASMTLIIVSMAAQIAAIAMAGFIKRMGDIPSPDVLQAPLRAIRPSREAPGWHGGTADQP
jgi:hypothetical protein